MFKRRLYVFVEYFLIKAVSLFFLKYETGVVILRLDAIGDYILFRNFLYELKNSPKFAYLPITLIGNQAWMDIAETFDSEIVDKFIWLDRNQIWDNKKYRIKKLIQLVKVKYQYLILPTYSRDFAGDSLVNIIYAKYKIASTGDYSNQSIDERRLTDSYFTQLIPVKPEIVFEFDRNKDFFEILLDKNLNSKPYLKAIPTQYHNKFNNYVVLFIGASAKFRQWDIINFNFLAHWLHMIYGYDILMCGGQNDINDSNDINLADWLHNLIGKTSLVEMVDILSGAKFVVSNETSIPHICVALSVPIFVIYNGNYFGRFTPYPEYLTDKYYPIYHPDIEKNLDDYKYISNQYGYGSNLDINQITLEQVKNKILENIDAVK
jgi:ADP-heptose:LPS heptosyltransferase